MTTQEQAALNRTVSTFLGFDYWTDVTQRFKGQQFIFEKVDYWSWISLNDGATVILEKNGRTATGDGDSVALAAADAVVKLANH